MNFHVISAFFFSSSFLLLAVLVLLKRRDEVARRWLYFSLFVTGWGVHYAFLVNNDVAAETALFATRLGNACAAFIPVTWLYFVCAFLNIERRKVFWVAWPVAWLIVATTPSKWFFSGTGPVKNFVHYPKWEFLYLFHTLNFFVVVAYGFYLVIRAYKEEESRERKGEILSLIVANAVGFIAGGSSFSLVFLRDRGLDLTPFIGLYPFLMVYAMIKHRVFDVEKLADAFRREKLAAVGILAASVNHELKNPLFIIRGNLEIGLRRLKDEIADPQKVTSALTPLMEKSLSQIDRASELMQRLSDFAKPELGLIRDEKVSIAEVFEKVLELVNYQFKLNKIKLTQRINPILAISFNKRQFEEVLFNLILNACQAMPQGGELILEAQKRDGSVLIRIQDSGSGINPSDRGKVFDAFYSTKGKEGTGLGLYITKQLIERRGGKIWFETSPKGTSFFVEFKGK